MFEPIHRNGSEKQCNKLKSALARGLNIPRMFLRTSLDIGSTTVRSNCFAVYYDRDAHSAAAHAHETDGRGITIRHPPDVALLDGFIRGKLTR